MWTVDIQMTNSCTGKNRADTGSNGASPTSPSYNLRKSPSRSKDTSPGTTTSNVLYTCNFLLLCTGYYDYDNGYTPEFKDREIFQGAIIHPQRWPKDFDYSNQNIVIIGSGATAVTLLPVLSEKASHVTMLQRSPSYMASVPAKDPVVHFTRGILPRSIANTCVRWYSILIAMLFYWLCVVFPGPVKKILMLGVQMLTGKDSHYIKKHFNPRYTPWDQRLCIVPDADLFESIRSNKASIVTDKVVSFTKDGILLDSTREVLKADVIVTATGLQLKLCGGIEFAIDGKNVVFSSQVMYKGVMFSNIPNAAISVGYTNNTWTLKCDLTFEYLCKLFKYMDEHGYTLCIPVREKPNGDANYLDENDQPVFNLSSGYIQRSRHGMPRQGASYPWRYNQNYLDDIRCLRFGTIADDVLKFE